MRTLNKLNTLMRIVTAIRKYCYQTADYRDPAHNKLISTYLKKHLSIRNWEFWQHLKPDERAAFVYNQDVLPIDTSSLQAFQLRLKQSKLAGYELFKFWRHAEHALITELPILAEKPAKDRDIKKNVG